MKPLNDLEIYAGDFEFWTNNSSEMNVEFNVLIDKEDSSSNYNDLFMEYVSMISLKIAKDIFSLLPISTVNIQVLHKGKTKLECSIKRKYVDGVKITKDFSCYQYIKDLTNTAIDKAYLSKK